MRSATHHLKFVNAINEIVDKVIDSSAITLFRHRVEKGRRLPSVTVQHSWLRVKGRVLRTQTAESSKDQEQSEGAAIPVVCDASTWLYN